MQHQIGSTDSTLRQHTVAQKETCTWLQKICQDQHNAHSEQRQHNYDQQARELELMAKIRDLQDAQNLANIRQLDFQVKVLENQTAQTKLQTEQLAVLNQIAKSAYKAADKVDNLEFRQSYTCQIPQDQGCFQIDSIDLGWIDGLDRFDRFDRFDRLDRFDSFDSIHSIR